MRKTIYTLLLASVIYTFKSQAQNVSGFETITLATDTFWNGSDLTKGFSSGNAYFTNYYDTSFQSWDGFAVSGKRDSVTPGYMNQYSAITAKGYNGSSNYGVAYGGFNPVRIKLSGNAKGKPVSGFYITNSTYAFYAMKNGSAFNKKFGGTSGNDSDWFKISIKGYKKAGSSADTTLDFYLADFRFADNSKDYFVKQWTWVDLSKLGNIDSLDFFFSSSDTAGGFGMNNPGYFCMDNFTTSDIGTGVKEEIRNENVWSIYPNPASDEIHLEGITEETNIIITDIAGKEMLRIIIADNKRIDVSTLQSGLYILKVESSSMQETKKFFIK